MCPRFGRLLVTKNLKTLVRLVFLAHIASKAYQTSSRVYIKQGNLLSCHPHDVSFVLIYLRK